MKVLMVNKFLRPQGGSETYALSLGKVLEKAGNRVEYFGMEEEKRIVGNCAESYTSNMDFHAVGARKFLYPLKSFILLRPGQKSEKYWKNYNRM